MSSCSPDSTSFLNYIDENKLFSFLTTFTFLVTGCFVYILHKYTFFERRYIPQAVRPIAPFGDLKKVLFQDTTLYINLWKYYNRFKRKGYAYGGLYLFFTPGFLIVDPILTQKILSEEKLLVDVYRKKFTHFPYPLCQQPYMMRANFPPTPLSPLETFSPTTPTASSTSTFLSPPSTFSPPSAVKPGQSILRDKRTPPQSSQPSPLPPPSPQTPAAAFKVPSGKEGSLKHRILIRPEDNIRCGPLDLQKPPEGRKRLQATMSPPRSPKKTLNNNTLPGSFAKGSLIQLHNGELRRIEDMRTEDFVMSAERSPELRLAESTVVKIEDSPQTGNATITLTYNQRRAQVEVESTVEHPYFVMGHGWASCNPERTQQCYGLKVHRLQVGDILISLTPREPAPCPSSKAGTTIMTTATTTSMTARQVSVNTASKTHLVEPMVSQTHPMNLHLTHPPLSMSPDSIAARKRRWSAPDQICDEEEQNNARRHRVE